MATLEKIRSRSVLLFTIIIVALLAFILGDFLTSGRTFFSDPTTLAKVDGKKIDINEFSRRVEEVRAQRQNAGYTDIDIAPIQQQVLDQMIFEALMEEEMDKMGIVVTDAELSSAMTGANALPMITAQAQRYGFESADDFYDKAFNPTKYNIPTESARQLQAAWVDMEKNTAEMLRNQKFGNLFMGVITANTLDAKALYDENASTSKVLIAKQDLSTLSDDEFAVTDADIKAQYDKRKNQFRLDEPRRVVDYIVVDVVPSATDRAAAQREVEDAIAALKAQPGTEGVNGNVNFGVNRVSTPKAKITNRAVKTALDSMAIDEVKVAQMMGTNYTIVKLLGQSNEVDSVNVDFALVEGDIAARDSVMRRLNAGAKTADLLADGTLSAGQDSIWLSLLDPQAASLKDQLLAAETGRYFAVDTVEGQQAYRIMRVKTRRAPVNTIDYAEITYKVEPSSATQSQLRADLNKFVNENKTSATFAENAPKANYAVMTAEITPSSLALNNLPDTREGVNWAMDAKKGEVSPVFSDESNTRLVAVAVKDIYDGEFIPTTDANLNRYLTDLARKDKKAAKLIADYQGKGKTVDDYASLMKTQVDTVNVTFGQPRIVGFYTSEPALQGKVAAAKQGVVTGPFQGSNSVIVFQVIDVEKSGMAFDEAQSEAQFNRLQGSDAMAQKAAQILRGKAKVENRIQKFYRK
ncbi:MAG: SurA N-terminal domain-containing protein [Bacteroidales bacterium]|nr:SurA N-terminal domain-containing protein [Bacteroidales bacterium]